MKKLKIFFLYIFMPLLIVGAPALQVDAIDLFNDACSSTAKAYSSPACEQKKSKGNTDPVSGTGNVFAVAVDIVALITGLAAVIMIILSGLTMITSSGNAEAVTSARRRLLAAIAGLALIILAWANNWICN